MYDQIISCMKQMLLSPAMTTYITAYEQDFESNLALTVKDANGAIVPFTFNDPLLLNGYALVDAMEPPRSPGAPYPRAYIFHLLSEYNEREQEDDIVSGIHQIGIAIIGSAVDPATAEQTTGRLASATKRYLESNQYIYGALPRSAGGSTLSAVDTVAPGVQVPKVCIAYHLKCVVKTHEYRY